MAEQSIHRAEIPLDDRAHGIDLNGDILHAAVRRPGAVDVWYLARPDGETPMRRSFQIVGTGQPLPAWLGRHHKTAITPDGRFVWHVMESFCPHPDVTVQAISGHGRGGECKECGLAVADRGDGWVPVLPVTDRLRVPH